MQLDIVPEELIVRAVKKFLPEMEAAQNPAPAPETLRAHYVGMVGGIPLPKEKLALLALKVIYLARSEIVDKSS